MRSSIFERESTFSPVPAGASQFLKKLDKKRTVGGSQGPSNLLKASWNFDKLVASYNDTGSLPPILSPTLPTEFDDIGSDSVFEKSLLKNYDSDDDKRDNDDIPLSMLSPTLPSIFEKRDDTSIKSTSEGQISSEQLGEEVTSPVRTTLNRTTNTTTNTKPNFVKWVNKLDDSTRPRFPLRIKFINQLKYKGVFGFSTTLEGFGITTATPEPEKRESQVPTPRSVKPEKNSKGSPERVKVNISPERKGGVFESNKIERTLTPDLRTSDNAKFGKSIYNENSVQSSPRRNSVLKAARPKGLASKNSTETKTDSKSTKTEDRRAHFNSKRNSLKMLLKQVQTEIETTERRLTSIVMEVDQLLLSVRANDYEEKYRFASGTVLTDKNWKLVDSEIVRVIEEVEDYTATQKGINLIQSLKVLKGLLIQLRAGIAKRTSSILQERVKQIMSSSTGEAEEVLNRRIIKMQQSIIDGFSSISVFLLSSRPDYLNSIVSNKFPLTWRARTTDKNTTSTDSDEIEPGSQTYYLPLGSYSNLSEISSLIHNYVREFLDLYNANNAENGVAYTLKCSN